MKPAFLSDIKFYGQSSRKRCLENTSSSADKGTSYGIDGNNSGQSSSGKENDGRDSGKENDGRDSGKENDGRDNGEKSSDHDGSGNIVDSKGTSNNKLETSDDEQQKFYCTLNQPNIKPAILRIVLPLLKGLLQKLPCQLILSHSLNSIIHQHYF